MARICKILVVEDDDGVRALLGDILDDHGYEFTLVADGETMREALDRHDYDVAIIDMSLPAGEGGIALAEAASERGCGIILTTGDLQQLARLMASGRRYLLKPFRVVDIKQLVDQVLNDNSALCVPRGGGDSPAPVGPISCG